MPHTVSILGRVVSLGDVRMMIAEWVPFGDNAVAALMDKLGMVIAEWVPFGDNAVTALMDKLG
ncbi:hypothetical protein T484DRAFT_1789053 [Baffinella frigidus]|nr:hypothetical protein T484DRAFT_1789053 [Cryptophyta sp. CCMP2293]